MPMIQIRIEAFGPPSQVARCVEVPDPGALSDWEVLVDVEACVVNWADIAVLAGAYGQLPKLPSGIGLEGAGIVRACGKSVSGIEPGDKVVVVANDNWVQRRKSTATQLYKLRPEVDLLHASGFKVGPCTALKLVRDQVKLPPRSWIVQTAPLSFVGRSVIELARHDGLRTLNLVRRPEAIEEILALGGDAAILVTEGGYSAAARQATGGEPIVLALDAVGGDGTGRLAELLAPGGTVVVYGMLSGRPASVPCDQLVFRNISVKGYWLIKALSGVTRQHRNDLMAEIEHLHVEHGLFKVPVAAEYGFREIAVALRHAETAGSAGKVILRPQRN